MSKALVLITEDDPLILRMYQKMFTFDGFEVIVAADGLSCLEKARSQPKPTMILLDIMMPYMNGLEVLDKLKADEATKHIPVIMLTNMGGDKDTETALAKGAVKYIIKSEHTPREVVDISKEILGAYTRDSVPEVTPAKKKKHA